MPSALHPGVASRNGANEGTAPPPSFKPRQDPEGATTRVNITLPLSELPRETPMAPAPTNHRMGPTEWGALVALAFLWSSVFFLIKVALGDMRPFTVVALRLGLGALILHVVVLASGARMPTSLRTWGAFAAMGALNNFLPFCLIAW